MIIAPILTRYEGLTQVQIIDNEINYSKQLYYNSGNPADKIEVFIEKQDNIWYALTVYGSETQEREFDTRDDAEVHAARTIYALTKQFIDNIS